MHLPYGRYDPIPYARTNKNTEYFVVVLLIVWRLRADETISTIHILYCSGIIYDNYTHTGRNVQDT